MAVLLSHFQCLAFSISSLDLFLCARKSCRKSFISRMNSISSTLRLFNLSIIMLWSRAVKCFPEIKDDFYGRFLALAFQELFLPSE